MNTNKQYDPNTFDLFGTSDTPDGDGRTGHSANAENPRSPEAQLPEIVDTELSVPRPLRVPGLKGEVLGVPVYSLRLVRERDHVTRLISTPADVARLCSEALEDLDREVFIAVALSTSNRVIGLHVCHVGTIDVSIASPREVYKFCLLVNARSVVVAHNHPSGNLEPSGADVQVSKQLVQAGEVLGIRLLDSLVIGHPEGKEPRYTSLAERGLL